MSNLYQLFLAGMNQASRPIGTLLFLGPTGSGKTRVVEAAAEVLFGNPNAVVKIDCAEFQHSHEIAKLVGSPPGYLGHRETSPLLSQENIDRFQTEEAPLSLVLFDEIEKASDSLWQLLLGILDKATLTLGDNRRVDFSQAIIVMHAGHSAAMFRDKFWLSVALTFPLVFWSSDLQHWLGYRAPTFPGSRLIPAILGSIVFVYGGRVFIQGAWPELSVRRPGMMTLISLAIIVAFATSLAATLGLLEVDVWWELATLISVMLLGHWLEIKAVAKARGALNALAALLPDSAERITESGSERVPLEKLHAHLGKTRSTREAGSNCSRSSPCGSTTEHS